MHAQGKRKSHKKTSFKDYLSSQQKSSDNFFSTIDISDQTKQQAPISDDDSLTYMTMPQPRDSLTNISNISEKSDSSRHSIPDVAEVNLVDNCTAGPVIRQDDEQGSPMSEKSANDVDAEIYTDIKSFLLADQLENIQVSDEIEFMEKLKIDEDSLVKVVSIFGNTGDGKSYTLNHTFFGGHEIFKTLATQLSCTVGVWAAYDPVHNAIIIDTEGLLGVTSNQNQRTRLLLKVLAISDVVIYRTKADRLHNDMFHFLGDASKAYLKHFSEELKAAAKRCNMTVPLSNLGPAIVIFHETQHTEVLGKGSPSESAEIYLRKRFADLGLSIDAFSALQYCGTRTTTPPTNFKGLLLAVKAQLRNISVRSPKKPAVIFNALKVLNEKFNGDIEKAVPSTFPDQYFTCTSVCLSCSARCTQTMNHAQEDINHSTDKRCHYQHQYDNKIFTCKVCYDRGKDIIVVPKTSASSDNTWMGLAKFTWSGYVLECPNCGIIFRSRQYWYGNQDPEKSVVRTEVKHVWPGGNPVLQGTHNAARRLLDGISYAGETIASISAKPTKMVSNWVTDQIAPPYWVPNAQITRCHSCHVVFTAQVAIHHCRACGQGFCDDCSLKKRPVPERGWGMEPVRVCDNCYDKQNSPERALRMVGTPTSSGKGSVCTLDHMERAQKKSPTITDSSERGDSSQLTARRMGETIGSTIGVVASALDYPLDMLRESARPAYWVPDSDIKACRECKEEFGPKLYIHHCRACGEGVCDPCSAPRRPVPSRGWDHPVRVCNTCNKKKGEL